MDLQGDEMKTNAAKLSSKEIQAIRPSMLVPTVIDGEPPLKPLVPEWDGPPAIYYAIFQSWYHNRMTGEVK